MSLNQLLALGCKANARIVDPHLNVKYKYSYLSAEQGGYLKTAYLPREAALLILVGIAPSESEGNVRLIEINTLFLGVSGDLKSARLVGV